MCSLFSNNIQKIIIMCGTQLTLPTPYGDTTRDALELQPIFPGNITPWAESTHFRSLKIWYLNPVFFCMINWQVEQDINSFFYITLQQDWNCVNNKNCVYSLELYKIYLLNYFLFLFKFRNVGHPGELISYKKWTDNLVCSYFHGWVARLTHL